ncbi:MAG: hypothetical protein CMF59_16730 [Leptospiraceae bacterium]|nr:hypothetical protein [Leptospiraceae bacterium]
MKRPGYRAAIKWIAENDESSCRDAEEMENLISVSLVSDLFGKQNHEVAEAVVRYRERKL